NLAGVDIGRGREPEAARKLGPEVADDIAEQIVRHDGVELGGVPHHFHGQSINVEVARLDTWELEAEIAPHALPQVVAVGQGVGFVAHAQALPRAPLGELKCESQDAFDAFARVQLFLHRNFVRSAALELAANVDVETFRVLPED